MYFQDRDIALDCINSQKLLNSTYTQAVSEASDTSMRNDLTSILNDEFNNQYMIFQVMNRKGWYKSFPANQQDLNNAKTNINNLNSQMQSIWQGMNATMQGASNQPGFNQTPVYQYGNQVYGDRPGQDWGGATNSNIEKSMWSNIGSYASQEIGTVNPSSSERNANLDRQS